jgi:hypothetical protein
MSGEDNLELMKTLDDAWNAQDWEVFRKRHAQDTAVYWPGQSIENSLENNYSARPFDIAADGELTLARFLRSNRMWTIERESSIEVHNAVAAAHP